MSRTFLGFMMILLQNPRAVRPWLGIWGVKIRVKPEISWIHMNSCIYSKYIYICQYMYIYIYICIHYSMRWLILLGKRCTSSNLLLMLNGELMVSKPSIKSSIRKSNRSFIHIMYLLTTQKKSSSNSKHWQLPGSQHPTM